ncbi:separin-like [Clytia hemisphaerica]
MPSILLTRTHCDSYKGLLEDGLNTENSYYILNPRNDLKRTETMFQQYFIDAKWQGIVGRAPTSDEFSKALTQHDLFVYCGHGSGQEYLGWDAMQRLHCKSVALLMGCSSGKLVAKGSLEAQGMVQYYLLSGSPAIVANLWDVTDKDIDLFLQQLLELWLTETNGGDLASCVSEAREACKLEYLIGAAPVVYGLPLVAR